MGETKIFLISRRWPQALMERFQESLGLKPKKAGHKMLRTYDVLKKKRDQKKP